MSRLTERIRSTVATASQSYLVIVVVALLVGVLFAPMAYGVGTETGTSADKVAVVEVPGLISPETSGPVVEALQKARQNDSIAAVVLKVDTPGGSLAATEELALEVERTAAEMPVVVSVGQMAASGGYYVSAPADEIYANPSSMVGSVGVNFVSLNADASSRTIQSGPDKSGGFTEAEAIEMAEVMVNGFYGMVLDHRGEKLELSRAELAHAKVYPSQEALHNGMIDEVGTTRMAIERAAELAGLDRYETVELDTTPERPAIPFFEADGESGTQTADAAALLDPAPGVETPVPTALYGTVPEEDVIVTTAGPEPVTTVDSEAAKSEVSADE
jgi:protease-4